MSTQTTDEGLKQLVDLPSLKHLDLRWTAVTKDGVQWYKGRRPNVEVISFVDSEP